MEMDPPALYKRALGVSKLIHGAFRDTCFVRTDKIPHPLINLSFVKEKKKSVIAPFYVCLFADPWIVRGSNAATRRERRKEKTKTKKKDPKRARLETLSHA